MLTAVAHMDVAGAKRYFSLHLTQNDYYSEGEHRPGQWLGLAGSKLGLQGKVGPAQFANLCDNRHPTSEGKLTQRQNVSGERRVYYDFTCSAPKSVSILAVTMGDERLVAAHESAAREAFAELEKFASARVRKAREKGDRVSGNLVAAEFLHTSSRALDPQLHTHFTVFNATWDPVEEKWKALQVGAMYRAIRFATQVYRNALAKSVMNLGYGIAKAHETSFEIAGVEQDTIRLFSKRSAERDRVVRMMEERLGRALTKDEVSHVIHHTRAKKPVGISTAEVRAAQLAQLTPEEVRHLDGLRRNGPGERVTTGKEVEALDFARRHVFERRSVVPEHELLEGALAFGQGTVDLGRLRDLIRQSKDLLETDRGLSTVAVLKQELEVLLAVRDGKGAVAPLHPSFKVAGWLGEDQAQAVRHLLTSTDRVTGIRGLAGTGKSTALKELDRALKEAGVEIEYCAPTSGAAEVLRKEGFPAVTLAKALSTSGRSGVVTIVDEAGAIGLGDMHRLLKSRERIILCGDTTQHGPVIRGDALRIIEEHSSYVFGQLSGIRRQRSVQYRQAVELASKKDPVGAFRHLERSGAIIEGSAKDLYQAVAESYARALRENRSVLVVAPTWREIDGVSAEIRTVLKRDGLLGPDDQMVSVFRSLGWTEAERGNPGQFQMGHWLRFHRRHGPIGSGELVEVVEKDHEAITVRRAGGQLARVHPHRAASSIDVGFRRDLPVAAGERLLAQANGPGITNGELVQVRTVQSEGIELQDGRALSKRYRTFAHGYAVTSHGSQGKTVDEVLVVASSVSLPAVNREQFYVSISRGRDRIQVFTDDRDLLEGHLTRSSTRVAAIETVQKGRVHRALERAIDWAAKWGFGRGRGMGAMDMHKQQKGVET
ncbi:MAG: relaxase domain-containing protein [Verrucomicrobiales bacterium]|nr:relaxase domain-containing protein [Verrucomicrobiales bacterium]